MKDVLPTENDVRKIFFKQQRKKNIIPGHANLTNKFNQEILTLRKSISNSSQDELNTDQLQQLDHLVKRKSDAEREFFEKLQRDLIRHIALAKKVVRLKEHYHEKRRIYSIDNNREITMLFDRYVALVIARAFHVRSISRDQAIRVIIDALRVATGGAKAHRTIFRFDIENFFESLDHEEVKRKLSNHTGIPRFAMDHINAVLEAAVRLDISRTGKPIGVPQGVPSSSVLAEVYLEELDNLIKRDSSVILYVRYVDDIIVICDDSSAKRIYDSLESKLSTIGLSLNKLKSKTLLHPDKNHTDFEYLGYKFNFYASSSQLSSMDISDAKYGRYTDALSRVVALTSSVNFCWADEPKVNLFLESIDYLLFPHATKENIDTPRIITGLAYNSRFASKIKGNNLEKLILSTFRYYKTVLGKSLNNPLNNKCDCCNRPIYRYDELRSRSTKINYNGVMFSEAYAHADDSIRERVEKLLWRSRSRKHRHYGRS